MRALTTRPPLRRPRARPRRSGRRGNGSSMTPADGFPVGRRNRCGGAAVGDDLHVAVGHQYIDEYAVAKFGVPDAQVARKPAWRARAARARPTAPADPARFRSRSGFRRWCARSAAAMAASMRHRSTSVKTPPRAGTRGATGGAACAAATWTNYQRPEAPPPPPLPPPPLNPPPPPPPPKPPPPNRSAAADVAEHAARHRDRLQSRRRQAEQQRE